MRIKFEWQLEELDLYHDRVKVIGGWIVYATEYEGKNGVAMTSTFIADKDHEWTIVRQQPVLHEIKKEAEFKP